MVFVTNLLRYYVVVETTQGGYHVMSSRIEQLSPEYVDEVYDGRGGVDYWGPFWTESAARFFESEAIATVSEPNSWGSANMTIQAWEGVSRKPWSNNTPYWWLIHTLAAESLAVQTILQSNILRDRVKCPVLVNVQKGLKTELKRLSAIATAQDIPENWRQAQVDANAILPILEVLSQVFDDNGTAVAFGWVVRMIWYYATNRQSSDWQRIIDQHRILR